MQRSIISLRFGLDTLIIFSFRGKKPDEYKLDWMKDKIEKSACTQLNSTVLKE